MSIICESKSSRPLSNISPDEDDDSASFLLKKKEQVLFDLLIEDCYLFDSLFYHLSLDICAHEPSSPLSGQELRGLWGKFVVLGLPQSLTSHFIKLHDYYKRIFKNRRLSVSAVVSEDVDVEGNGADPEGVGGEAREGKADLLVSWQDQLSSHIRKIQAHIKKTEETYKEPRKDLLKVSQMILSFLQEKKKTKNLFNELHTLRESLQNDVRRLSSLTSALQLKIPI